MDYTTPQWATWGLSIADSVRGEECQRAVQDHNRVAAYLSDHPDVAADYRSDQSGTVKYYDVLKLAEQVRA